MSEILSGSLAAALNTHVVQEQFDIVRPTINGLLALVAFGEPVRPEAGNKITWLNMGVDADSLTLAADATNVDTTITVDDGSKARAGMVLFFDGEAIVITAVSGNDLTVLRGQGSTTAVALTTDDVLSIDSVGREENSQAQTDGIYQPDEVENYFQTMDTGIEMSRRALATLQHGNTNDLSFQVNERVRQLAIQMNKTLMRGRKMSITISGKAVTYTGGLSYFFDQAGSLSTDAAAATLTLDMINTLQAEVVKRGGMVNALVVSVEKARELQILVNANYASARLTDFISDEGGLMRLPSDLPLIGGASDIVIDTSMLDSEIYLVDSSRMKIVPMANGNAADSGAWRTLDATLPGQDGQKARIIGDFAMELRDTNTHFARLTNIG